MPDVPLECSNCHGTNVTAHYQHIVPGASINHHWMEFPAMGPVPTGVPHPDPCPTDDNLSAAVYTQCNDCGFIQPW